jgi:arylsulfatase A-like enzyme
LPAGTRVPALTENVDLLPTLLSAAGLQPDFQPDGHDLLPLLRGETEKVRDLLFLGAFNYNAGVVTDDGYKFIDHRGEKPDELFNLRQDPLEQTNLATQQRDLARDLHHRLWEFHEPWRWKRSRRHKA